MHFHSRGLQTPGFVTIVAVTVLLASMLLAPSHRALAQQSQPAATTATPSGSTTTGNKPAQESSQEVVTFQKQVNLVLVPVVVRDKKGKAVGSLVRDDFQIFDDGKPQSVSTFNIESNQPATERAHKSSVLGNIPISNIVGRPSHFFAYLFDDLHLNTGDLQQVRAAAKKHLQSGMGAEDRAALYTTSGHISLEFTSDKALLSQAMDRVTPRSLGGDSKCPYMNYFLAQTIVNEYGASSVTPAWDAASQDAWSCMFQKQEHLFPTARDMTLDAARREVQVGDAETQGALRAIISVVQRLSMMPGARTLVLVSPGFQTGDEHFDQDHAISLATTSNIVINTLDARGLYTGIPDASGTNGPGDPLAAQMEDPINRAGLLLQTSVLADLADGTGGKFFRDNNDLLGAFDQLASPPEYIYVLGFRPENLKKGGQYHHLKVVLSKNHDGTVQARRGYLETAGTEAPEKLLTAELQQALFSHDETHTVPIALKTEYSKKEGTNRELSVTTQIDLGGVHFSKDNKANIDNLTLVCGLFDSNGNYLQGKKREISLRMADDVLKQYTEGMNIKTTFDVEPGSYLIRVVLRDAGNGLLSTVNGSGVIE